MKAYFFFEILSNKKVLLTGMIFGFIFAIVFHYVLFGSHLISKCINKLAFINPSLNCNTLDSKAEVLSTLENKLEVMIDGFKKSGKVKRMGVFVRDLTTSRFAGVNENEDYYMASLLKTPLLIGGFKLAEVEPKILDQKIVYTGQPNLYEDQVIKAEDALKIGQSYSIRELMERSIVYSDNTAAQILFEYYPEGFMDRIMEALGLNKTRPNGQVENFVTARDYAGIFRLLYNSSYLTNEYSNEALSILTKAKFNLGATSKLPKTAQVAHKFAERTVMDPITKKITSAQFHECGLVYEETHPFVFCVMTEGTNYASLEEAVGDISLLIYEEMTKE